MTRWRRFALPSSRWRAGALLAVVPLYVVAGTNHFVNPDFYLAIMPAYLPAHLLLVHVSGVIEIGLGLAVMAPRLRPAVGWLLVALLVAVFPANLNMALNAAHFPAFEPLALYLRLPLQGVLALWAYWATRPDSMTTQIREEDPDRMNSSRAVAECLDT